MANTTSADYQAGYLEALEEVDRMIDRWLASSKSERVQLLRIAGEAAEMLDNALNAAEARIAASAVNDAPTHDPSGRGCAIAGRVMRGDAEPTGDACNACLTQSGMAHLIWTPSLESLHAAFAAGRLEPLS